VSHRLVELAIEVEEQAASEEAPSGAAENCPQRGPSMGGVRTRRLPLPLKSADARQRAERGALRGLAPARAGNRCGRCSYPISCHRSNLPSRSELGSSLTYDPDEAEKGGAPLSGAKWNQNKNSGRNALTPPSGPEFG
jgi:hypothetical protein